MQQVSLARALSKFGLASRSAAVVMIREGRVQVDGRVERNPNRWLDPRTARIEVDGARLIAADHQYLAMHKPAGYVTTSSDERGRETVYALLPPDLPWLFPVGRLDKETSGLLFFTNDVRWGELISGPAHRITKTYAVTADRPVEEAGPRGHAPRHDIGRRDIASPRAKRSALRVTAGPWSLRSSRGRIVRSDG